MNKRPYKKKMTYINNDAHKNLLKLRKLVDATSQHEFSSVHTSTMSTWANHTNVSNFIAACTTCTSYINILLGRSFQFDPIHVLNLVRGRTFTTVKEIATCCKSHFARRVSFCSGLIRRQHIYNHH